MTTTSTGAAGSEAGDSGGSGGAPNDGGVIDASDASIEAAPSDVSDSGGPACFPEDVVGADAGTPPCAQLPYYAVTCADDAGAMDAPLGAITCDYYDQSIKVAAFIELFDCLKAIPGDDAGTTACSPAHDAAAMACASKIFNRTSCTVPDVTIDGGTFGCAQVVASCPSDDAGGGITLDRCQSWVGPFNATARDDIFACYWDPATPAGTSCADKFENYCVFP